MPQILDELAVALTVEASRFNTGMSQADKTIENMRRRFASVQGTIDRATQRMDAFERETNQVRTATDRVSRSLQTQRDAVNTLGRRILGLIGVYFGFRQTVRFIRESTEAFFEQSRASNELGVALQRAGIVGSAALAKLERGATDLQSQFNLADEAILSATATISRMVPALRTPDLERAQRAVAGLSQIMGGTEEAAKAVAKALNGQVVALQRAGVVIEKTGTAQDRLNQILASPAVQTALVQLAANAKTVEGRVQAASTQWGEFKETLGGVMVDMVSAGKNANSLAGALQNLNKNIIDNREEWVRTGRTIVETVGVIATTVTNVVQIAVSGLANLFSVVRFQFETMQRVVQNFDAGPLAVGRALFGGGAQADARSVVDDFAHRGEQVVNDINQTAAAITAARERVAASATKFNRGAGGVGFDPQDLALVEKQADRVADALRAIVAEEAGFRALREAVRGTSIEFDPVADRAAMLGSQMQRLTALMGEFPRRAGEIASVLARIIPELNSLTLEMEHSAFAAKQQAEWLARIPEIMRDNEDATRDALELQRQYAEIDWRPAMDKAKRELDRMEDTAQSIGSAFEGALVSIVSATDSIADAIKRMVQSIIADLARLTLQRTIIDPIVGAIGRELGGSVRIPGAPATPQTPLYEPFEAGLRPSFVPAGTGRFASPAIAPAAAPMTVVMQNTFEIRSIDTREGAQFLQQHAPAIGQLAAREFQKSAGLQSLVRGRR